MLFCHELKSPPMTTGTLRLLKCATRAAIAWAWAMRRASYRFSVVRLPLCRLSRCAEANQKRAPVLRSWNWAIPARIRWLSLSPLSFGRVAVQESEWKPCRACRGSG